MGDYDFLLMDYRGYGNSEGCAVGDGAQGRCGGQILNEMVERGGTDRSRTHLVAGRSLGKAAFAVWLAAQEDFASLILISPFDSIAAIAADAEYQIFPVETLIEHPFRSIEHADEIDEPTLVIKAESDRRGAGNASTP
ncbi:MAG: hypothetical protein U5O39_00485 [Gammaproteobacteria bacterium]|nr:hypothetical protein [Gammaproteobacteria bacterium]